MAGSHGVRPHPTGTVTFLFTDIEGSTARWESQPDDMARDVADHDRLLDAAVADHGGIVFTTAGDSFSAAFSDPLDAVEAATTAQRGFGKRAWQTGPLRVRMGLHVGVAHERGGDYFGPVVNRTARIMAAGHGGQVLLSGTAAELVGPRLDRLRLVDLGTHRLKDLGDPESIHQLTGDGLLAGFPDLRTLDAAKGNLPAQLSSFVGRVDELRDLSDRLRASRLVTLTGVGGSGKTRLALQAAAELAPSTADGVWVVELAPVTTTAGVTEEIAAVLGLDVRSIASDGEDPHLEAIAAYLSTRSPLLLLDNCEHLIRDVAVIVQRLLSESPGLRVLTTSREGLGLRGEQLIQVPPLDTAPGAEASDAAALFHERAAEAGTIALGTDARQAVDRICTRLDGMPLAIELAAARTRILDLEAIESRLDDAFRVLTGGARTALPRQQTLEATIAWSYDLLNEAESALFDRLAVFHGGFTLSAAEAIVSGDGVDALDVLDLVGSLVEKSMVQRREVTGRLGLLEALRQFALAKLVAHGSAEAWRRRHADHWREVATTAWAGTRSADQLRWFERLDADHANLRSAIEWLLEHDEPEPAGQMATGLWWFWNTRGHVDVGLGFLRRLVDRSGELSPETRCMVFTALAQLEFEGGEIELSLGHGERSVEEARRIDDDRLLAFALLYWANTAAHNFGLFDEADTGYDEALELATGLDDAWLVSWLQLNKGWTARLRGRHGPAAELLESAWEGFNAHGILVGRAWAETGLGALHAHRGDLAEAEHWVRRAIDGHVSLGAKGGQIFDRSALAQILQATDRHQEAVEQLVIARDLDQQVTRNSALDLVSSRIFRQAGDLRTAFESLAAEDSLPPTDIFFRFELGLLAAATGLPNVAGTFLVPVGASLDDTYEELGSISSGEFEAAMAAIEQALDEPMPTDEWLEGSADWAALAEDALRAIDRQTRDSST